MNDTRTIHAVSHTHWDREWYFSTLDTQLFALKAFSELIEALENNPRFVFHLDGQSSIFDDFVRLRPEMTERARALVAQKRLLIGPWYTQPDLFNICTESLFRNLRIGMHHAKQAGYCMQVLYLPDTFGSHAQLPQIAHAFGLPAILLRRGYDPNVMGPTELSWEALNGDTVTTVITPFGYSLAHPERGGRWRNFSRHHLDEETFPLIARMKTLTASEDLLCPIGGDQVSCDADFEKLINAINLHSQDRWEVSSYERFFATLDGKTLPHWRGEFRIPRFARVHKSIGSSRYDIKKANFDAEEILTRLAEPMLAIARLNGIAHGDALLEQAWRWLLESHAHDSMGGCNSDETNRDILHRCRQAQQIGEAIYSLHARQILANLAPDKNYRFLLSNGTSSPTVTVRQQTLITPQASFCVLDETGQPVRVVLRQQQKIQRPRHVLLTPDGEVETEQQAWYYENVVDILNAPVPPLGLALFFVAPASAPQPLLTHTPDAMAIENTCYRLSLHRNALRLEDKIQGRVLEPLLLLHDISDDGDLYDFSPLPDDDGLLFSAFQRVAIHHHPQCQEMHLRATLTLPEGLNDDRCTRSETTHPVAVDLLISLEEDVIRFAMRVDNQVREHRLQLRFNSGKVINAVTADVPFGSITRQNQTINSAMGFAEMPVDSEPFMHQLSAHSDFHFFARGLKEYEYHEEELRVTLFRGTGNLGKDDLLYRPGRASGQRMATPEGNLIGKLHFEFALCLAPLSPAQLAVRQQHYSFSPVLWQWQQDRSCLQRLDNVDLHIAQQEIVRRKIIDALPEGYIVSGVDVPYGQTLVRLYNPSAEELPIPAQWLPYLCNAMGEPVKKSRLRGCDHLTLKI
ncbi:hypothetical protein DBY68_009370 [Pseudocitrobacter sp. RIT415]|uniref:glycoside hydrolase family 38 N-terminal domain-containing protein n=1 Tax=Pseudocitrobacter sp. RIT415 TaxID=2202163 RepID=UPI000D39C676|nr:hypothetical protein [Pseudocitrobacter sp. RIT 415]RAU50124.1 hypothetical protein DBY68_009370 [Pseudocitrobacter sp. RIT 415]